MEKERNYTLTCETVSEEKGLKSKRKETRVCDNAGLYENILKIFSLPGAKVVKVKAYDITPKSSAATGSGYKSGEYKAPAEKEPNRYLYHVDSCRHILSGFLPNVPNFIVNALKSEAVKEAIITRELANGPLDRG